MKERIVIRVDASVDIGLGHLKRCVEIAHQLNKMAYQPTLVLNSDFKSADIAHIPFDVYLLSTSSDEELINLCSQIDCQIIFFDMLHYQTLNNLDNFRRLLEKLKRNNFLMAGMGDYEPIELPFDVQINPYRKVDKRGIVSGFDYLVIPKDIIKNKSYDNDNNNQILVTFGGSDVRGVTHEVVSMLEKSNVVRNDWKVSVCIGDFFDEEHIKSIKDIVARNPNFKVLDGMDLHSQMHKHQLGIISGGLTKFECAYLGIPVIIISQFKVEKSRAIQYSLEGAARYLCDLSELSEDHAYFSHKIDNLLCNKE